MPKKIDQKNTDAENESGIEKVGLKKPMTKNKEKIETTDERWSKVESIIGAAKEAYQSGSSDFDTIVGELIATLQSLREEEAGQNGLGGLGVGGPQMDIPEGEAPASDQNKTA